jgi:hypothetical protein
VLHALESETPRLFISNPFSLFFAFSAANPSFFSPEPLQR